MRARKPRVVVLLLRIEPRQRACCRVDRLALCADRHRARRRRAAGRSDVRTARPAPAIRRSRLCLFMKAISVSLARRSVRQCASRAVLTPATIDCAPATARSSVAAKALIIAADSRIAARARSNSSSVLQPGAAPSPVRKPTPAARRPPLRRCGFGGRRLPVRLACAAHNGWSARARMFANWPCSTATQSPTRLPTWSETTRRSSCRRPARLYSNACERPAASPRRRARRTCRYARRASCCRTVAAEHQAMPPPTRVRAFCCVESVTVVAPEHCDTAVLDANLCRHSEVATRRLPQGTTR